MAEEKLPPAVSVPLKVSAELDVPVFANLVLFNEMAGPGIGDQVILSFFHVFVGSPPEPSDEASKEPIPRGEAVARITMSPGTAKAVRNLLIRQMPPSPEDLDALKATKGDTSAN